VDLWFYRGERPSRSVSRERREPQAGAASCLSKAASKAADASGDGVSVPEPNTARTAIGEGLESLPGSKSVARAEGVARNRGGPESPCRTNCEGQAGREAQRQEVPPGTPGVGSAHSIQRQGASPEAGEGADVLAKHTQATRAVRMTDPTGKPSCARRERVNTKSPVREYRPPGSVRGALGNWRPYLDKPTPCPPPIPISAFQLFSISAFSPMAGPQPTRSSGFTATLGGCKYYGWNVTIQVGRGADILVQCR